MDKKWKLHSDNGFNPCSVGDLSQLQKDTEADLVECLDMLEGELDFLKKTLIYWRPESRERPRARILMLESLLKKHK